MRFTIVAALDFNGAIGAKGTIPWRAPADLGHFKSLTMGQHVLFGRKTYESIPKRLEGRELLVLTRNGKTPLPLGGQIVFDVGQIVLGFARQTSEIYVGGGAEVYRQLLPLSSRLELTIVQLEAADADTFFPAVDMSAWKLLTREERAADEKNPAMTFLTLERQRVDNIGVVTPRKGDVGCWKQALITFEVPIS